jgi:hypothetical protein
LALAFGPPAFSASDSSQTETCRDLIASVKASDCMKPVARFLDGATVVLGFGLHSSRMTLKRNDSTVASLTGILTPAPYYGFSLPKRFFGSTRFGWEVSLAYGSSVAVYQNISRNDKNHIVDLGTYGSVTLGAISPSVFFAWGARDEDPTVNMRFGLGLGLGLGSVRGTAYYTEISEGGGESACFDAASAYLGNSLDKAGLKAACSLRSFRRLDLGGSSRLFWDWRWRFLYGGAVVNGLRMRGAAVDLLPEEVVLKLAYIHVF